MVLRILLIALSLLISGCKPGPGSDGLKEEIQAKLDTRFGEGLFFIQELSRKGSYPFQELGDPTERLLLYYDANILFMKDYSLSEWDQLDKSALASVLGAGPLGVKGVRKEGNSKGDHLMIHGTSTYEKKGSDWISSMHIAPQANVAADAPRSFDEDGEIDTTLPTSRLLNEIETRLRTLRRSKGTELSEIEGDLESSLLSVELRLDALEGRESLLAGRQSGEYFRLSEAMQELYGKRGEELRAYATSGSDQNLSLLNQGLGTFAISQNDVAHRYYREGHQELRAVASLYPELMHIVVSRQSKISQLSELKGRKISIGQKGSGTLENARLILSSSGLKDEDFTEVRTLESRQALDLLVSGELDAVFLTMAVPSRMLEEASSKARLALIPVPEKARDAALKSEPWLVKVNIARNSYSGVEADVPTLGVTAMALTRKDTPARRVEDFLSRLFDANSDFGSQFGMAHYITTRTATVGIGMPLHDSARQFFQGRGVLLTE